MTKAQDEAVAKIAKKFRDKMKKQGMDLEGAGPGKDGTPTISFYVHGPDCLSRRGSDCNCRIVPAVRDEEKS